LGRLQSPISQHEEGAGLDPAAFPHIRDFPVFADHQLLSGGSVGAERASRLAREAGVRELGSELGGGACDVSCKVGVFSAGAVSTEKGGAVDRDAPTAELSPAGKTGTLAW
jgi:hypothetical protein